MTATSESGSNMILTVESIPNYLRENFKTIGFGISLFSSNVSRSDSRSDEAMTAIAAKAKEVMDAILKENGIEVTTIQGGNVNYAFCIKFPFMGEYGKTVFLKQAPEFVAIFGPDGFPLTSERMQRELDVYTEYKTILGDTLSKKYLPDIYYFDKKHMIVIMEFLDGHDLLDHALVTETSSSSSSEDDIDDDDYNNEEKIAVCLGDFMGRVHSATHSSNVSKERFDYLTKHFENREMRDVQLEFVFTKCYKEATNEQRSGLTLTPEFMKEIELLKKQYNGAGGGGHVLCHGDLHPGSVMVNTSNGSTKVIDPEFTVYGPAGLDVGSLLHGYCLGAIHQAYSNNPMAVNRIILSAETLWYSYKKALMNNDDNNNGISAGTMKEIEIETVGFTVAEVCRTCLGFAGGRLWLQFDDVETKAASTKAALQLVDKCMIARHDGGIDLLFNELKKICNASLGHSIYYSHVRGMCAYNDH